MRAAAQEVRQAVEAAGAEVLTSIETVANALAVRIDDRLAADLASIPGVARVYPVREVRPELDHAAPLHKALEAWRALGGADRAGEGAKIAILDSGIDPGHPAFQDAGLAPPPGYPKAGQKSDEEFTSGKVIVARDYEQLIRSSTGQTVRDQYGHGTGVAMAAAGVLVDAPFATISGIAPKARLGIYKIFAGNTEQTLRSSDDAILKALDDAVADGMDIINMSFGAEPAARPSDDLLVAAVERAAAAGVLVVKAAGNSGASFSITSPGVAPSAITVGANWNDRVLAPGVVLDGLPPYAAEPGSGPKPKQPVAGPLLDVARLDQNGLACSALPEGSLDGRIALILRGDCIFEIKLGNAQKAGAAGAIVYTDAARPDAATMAVGAVTLPAVMLSNADGVDVKRRSAEDASLTATLRFDGAAFPAQPNRVASFSSRGPSTANTIKPDLVAAGVSVYTATQRSDKASELYDPDGFLAESGTSFSGPLVAGAAALIKAARPGLTVAQYRSLLVNSASALVTTSGSLAPVQQAGAGALDVEAALRNTIAVSPAALNFGAGVGIVAKTISLTVFNLGASPDTLSATVEPLGAGPLPAVSTSTLSVPAGGQAQLSVEFTGIDLPAGEYQGFLRLRGSLSGVETRVPYWYAVASSQPRFLRTVNAPETGSPGTMVNVLLQVTDPSGLPIAGLQPAVTATVGGGTVNGVRSLDQFYPGVYQASLRLGPAAGRNQFRVEVADLREDFTIDTSAP